MSKVVTISPFTRLKGHSKVTVHLDDQGNVDFFRFHVIEFRGFEKFCEGRMVWDMPVITTRICGICPVNHHLAAVKAADDLFGVEIPPAAKKLRELIQMSQYIHSHSLHFFHLAAPDLLFGPDAEPETRNIIGIIKTHPELAQKAIRLRQIGQTWIERVGGRSIHPVSAIPGGMSKSLSHEDRYIMLKEVDEAVELAHLAVSTAKDLLKKYADLIPDFGVVNTYHLGLVKDDTLELYDGQLRLRGPEGEITKEFEPKSYLDYLGERVEDFSYLKFPFYKKAGWPREIYRVCLLARLHAADRIDTPLAQDKLTEFKKIGQGKAVQEPLYYHYSRTMEILYVAERAKKLLTDDEIVSDNVRIKVERRAGEGVDMIEAPREVLIHHYEADDIGKTTKANLIVATVKNKPAIKRSVNAVAKAFID